MRLRLLLQSHRTAQVTNDGDWLLKLFAQAEPTGDATAPPKPSTDSIRDGSVHCLAIPSSVATTPLPKTALQQLSQPNPIAQFIGDDASQTITLTAPRDLQERLRVTLPLEVRNGDHRYALCAHSNASAHRLNWPDRLS